MKSIVNKFWHKVCVSFPAGMFVLDEHQYAVIYALLMMIILDTVLGMWVAVKFKRFSSYGMGRITGKIGRYSIALASVWIVGCLNPNLFGWAFSAFGTFFVLTELFSNFEKLSLLGLKLPTKMVAKLNENYNIIDPEKIKKILDKK